MLAFGLFLPGQAAALRPLNAGLEEGSATTSEIQSRLTSPEPSTGLEELHLAVEEEWLSPGGAALGRVRNVMQGGRIVGRAVYLDPARVKLSSDWNPAIGSTRFPPWQDPPKPLNVKQKARMNNTGLKPDEWKRRLKKRGDAPVVLLTDSLQPDFNHGYCFIVAQGKLVRRKHPRQKHPLDKDALRRKGYDDAIFAFVMEPGPPRIAAFRFEGDRLAEELTGLSLQEGHPLGTGALRDPVIHHAISGIPLLLNGRDVSGQVRSSRDPEPRPIQPNEVSWPLERKAAFSVIGTNQGGPPIFLSVTAHISLPEVVPLMREAGMTDGVLRQGSGGVLLAVEGYPELHGTADTGSQRAGERGVRRSNSVLVGRERLAAGLEETLISMPIYPDHQDGGRYFAQTAAAVNAIARTFPREEGAPDISESLRYILRVLRGNAVGHYLQRFPSGSGPMTARVVLSLAEEKHGTNTAWFLQVRYRDNNPHPWEVPVHPAVTKRGESRKSRDDWPRGIGLTRAYDIVRAGSGTLAVEALDTDGRRKRLSYSAADREPDSLTPLHDHGTEILIQLPVPAQSTSLQTFAERIRSVLAGLEETEYERRLTDPRLHNDEAFTYWAHMTSGWSAALMAVGRLQPSLLTEPHELGSFSVSLLHRDADQEVLGTYQNQRSGYIIRVPEDNIAWVAPFDFVSDFTQGYLDAVLKERDQRGLLPFHKLLEAAREYQTATEALVLGSSPSGKKVETVGIVVIQGPEGTDPDGAGYLIREGQQRRLPIVRIQPGKRAAKRASILRSEDILQQLNLPPNPTGEDMVKGQERLDRIIAERDRVYWEKRYSYYPKIPDTRSPSSAGLEERKVSLERITPEGFAQRFPAAEWMNGARSAYLTSPKAVSRIRFYAGHETLWDHLQRWLAEETAQLPEGMEAYLLRLPADAADLEGPGLIIKDWMLKLPYGQQLLPEWEAEAGQPLPSLPTMILFALKGAGGEIEAVIGVMTLKDAEGNTVFAYFV